MCLGSYSAHSSWIWWISDDCVKPSRKTACSLVSHFTLEAILTIISNSIPSVEAYTLLVTVLWGKIVDNTAESSNQITGNWYQIFWRTECNYRAYTSSSLSLLIVTICYQECRQLSWEYWCFQCKSCFMLTFVNINYAQSSNRKYLTLVDKQWW